MSLDISMKALLESGVHFGHRTNRWDPRMKPYIFTERNGIHIIDLQQTVQRMKESYNIVRDAAAAGGTVLFVGTKRQAQETVQTEAERCGMPFVIERWLPGTLTNWMTIHQRIMELERLEKMRDSGEIDRLVKKEGLMIERKIKRLLVHLSGIRHMNGVPDMIFVVDIVREDTAVHEANLKKIPVVAMVDTNCNPENIDYLIPANDDAIRAIKLITNKIADAVLEGKDMRKEEELDFEQQAPLAEGEERVRAHVGIEEEVDDADLLGEATLQKLAETKREAEEAAAAAETAKEKAEAEAEADVVEKAEEAGAKAEADVVEKAEEAGAKAEADVVEKAEEAEAKAEADVVEEAKDAEAKESSPEEPAVDSKESSGEPAEEKTDSDSKTE